MWNKGALEPFRHLVSHSCRRRILTKYLQLELWSFQTFRSPTLSSTKGPPEPSACSGPVDSHRGGNEERPFLLLWFECGPSNTRLFTPNYHDSLTYVQSIVTQTDKILLLLFPHFQQSDCKLSPGLKLSPLKDIKAFCMEDLKILPEEKIRHSFHLYYHLTYEIQLSITQYCAGDKIENEMGWACGTYGWGEGSV